MHANDHHWLPDLYKGSGDRDHAATEQHRHDLCDVFTVDCDQAQRELCRQQFELRGERNIRGRKFPLPKSSWQRSEGQQLNLAERVRFLQHPRQIQQWQTLRAGAEVRLDVDLPFPSELGLRLRLFLTKLKVAA